MKVKLILINIFFVSFYVTNAQTDVYIKLTLKAGGCHNIEPFNITVIARKSILKNYLQKQLINLDNCNSLLQSTDDILAKGAPIKNELEQVSPDGGGPDNNIHVENPDEFVDLYKLEKKKQLTGELCIKSDGEISFSIGNEDGSITISSKGSFSLSAKSSENVKHTVEF